VVLFRRAQRLHNAQEPGAIAAWDAYLRVASTGALVPEAKYNRALALIRGGRFAEARAALAPFAAGQFGGYRKQEAQQLIERLPR
jgi:TolA-binding protein